jgi:hypothetical protein
LFRGLKASLGWRKATAGQISPGGLFQPAAGKSISLRSNDLQTRAALKSGYVSDQVTEHQINAAAHFFLEGGAGAVAGLALPGRPSPIFALDRAAEKAQHGGGDGVTDADLFSAHFYKVWPCPILPEAVSH